MAPGCVPATWHVVELTFEASANAGAVGTSTHRLRMRVTRVAAVRCCTSERPLARAKVYAA